MHSLQTIGLEISRNVGKMNSSDVAAAFGLSAGHLEVMHQDPADAPERGMK